MTTLVNKARHVFWPKRPWSRWRVTLVSLVAILCALAFTELSHANISQIRAFLFSNLDASTEGKIIEAKSWRQKGKYTSSYHYRAWYSYEVDGKAYVGNLIHLGPHRSETELRAKGVVAKYPIGASVVVYYDSKTPSYSLLDKSESGWWTVSDTAFMVISIPLIIWICARYSA